MYKKLISSILFLSASSAAHAAGYALIEQNASNMGNAFAGASAIAEDASTIYFNPAGMTYIDGTQIVGALHLIKPNAEFSDQGSIAATARPLGDDGGNAGDLAFVPNMYYKRDVNETWQFGLGVNSTFGLKTEYDKDWLGRFQAVKSDLKIININPSFALKANDKLSLGFGISAVFAKAELTSAVNFGPFGEGYSTVEGDDWGFGFNVGAIYQATENTRLGVAYRSKVKLDVEGDVDFDHPAGLPAPFVMATPDGDVKTSVTLPETLSISSFTKLNGKWDLMADITWTRWSRFQELAIYRDNGALLTNTPENWHNTMRYSLGVNYHYNDKITLRTGIAYDEEAIDDAFRTTRIPGNDRKWLSLGLGWQVTPETKLDIAYAHLFISDARIRDDQSTPVAPSPFSKGAVIGKYKGDVDILSVQASYHF